MQEIREKRIHISAIKTDPNYYDTPAHRRFVKALRERQDKLVPVFRTFEDVLDGVRYVWPIFYLRFIEFYGIQPDLDFEKAILNNQPHIRSTGIPNVASVL
jgi:hypothetical protein